MFVGRIKTSLSPKQPEETRSATSCTLNSQVTKALVTRVVGVCVCCVLLLCLYLYNGFCITDKNGSFRKRSSIISSATCSIDL